MTSESFFDANSDILCLVMGKANSIIVKTQIPTTIQSRVTNIFLILFIALTFIINLRSIIEEIFPIKHNGDYAYFCGVNV